MCADGTGLAAFLKARLDEDEAMALAAGANDAERQWEAADHSSASRIVTDANGDALIYNEGTPGLEEAAHIARHDPARALREVEAKRAVLDLYERTLAIVRAPVDLQALAAEKPVIRELRARDYLDAERELCVLDPVVRYLAAIDSGHPDYDPSCKP